MAVSMVGVATQRIFITPSMRIANICWTGWSEGVSNGVRLEI
jgi:hypothetical protein